MALAFTVAYVLLILRHVAAGCDLADNIMSVS